jgi:hypothetical protein
LGLKLESLTLLLCKNPFFNEKNDSWENNIGRENNEKMNILERALQEYYSTVMQVFS